MSQGLYLAGPISATQLFQDFRPRVCSGGRHIYSSNNSWCEFVPQLQIGTPNQSLSMGFFASLQTTNQVCSPVFLRPNLDHPNQDQGIDDASSTRQQGSGRSISCSILHLGSYWRIDCPGGHHESKKNCNPFLWERWHSTIPRKIIKKHILSFFGEIFACHLNSRMIIQYYYTSITRVSRHFCIQIYRQKTS